jgi:hypothetical protein
MFVGTPSAAGTVLLITFIFYKAATFWIRRNGKLFQRQVL